MTRMTDLIHNTKAVKATAGTVAGVAIDTIGFYSALFIALADEATFTVVESDDAGMADAKAVPASQIHANANTVNVVPTKRYIKVTAGDAKVAGLLFGADIDGMHE